MLTVSPFRLSWTWGSFYKKKKTPLLSLKVQGSTDGVCACVLDVVCVKICITPSAYVGHEDCLNSPLHSKMAWVSAEGIKMLATVTRISLYTRQKKKKKKKKKQTKKNNRNSYSTVCKTITKGHWLKWAVTRIPFKRKYKFCLCAYC